MMQQKTDIEIEKEIRKQIKDHKIDGEFDIHVNGGIVSLKGEVNSLANKMKVEQLTTTIEQVKKTINNISIKEESTIPYAVSVAATELSRLSSDDPGIKHENKN